MTNARAHIVDADQDVICTQVEDVRLIAAAYHGAMVNAFAKIDTKFADLLDIIPQD